MKANSWRSKLATGLLVGGVFFFAASDVSKLWAATRDENSALVQDLREFLKEEEKLVEKMNEISGPDGTLDAIGQKIKHINSERRLHELKIKWIMVCPASFLINLSLAASQLAKTLPPYSEGFAAAVGTFGMLYVFDAVDKYWNRHFQQDIDETLSNFIEKSIEIRRADEIQSIEAREVDFRNIEHARVAIERSVEREMQLTTVKNEVYRAYIKKRMERRLANRIKEALGREGVTDQKVDEAIGKMNRTDSAFDDLRSRMLTQRLEQTYYQQVMELLHQRAKLVASIRSKFVHGDNRFRGKDRIGCAQLLTELTANTSKSLEKPT